MLKSVVVCTDPLLLIDSHISLWKVIYTGKPGEENEAIAQITKNSFAGRRLIIQNVSPYSLRAISGEFELTLPPNDQLVISKPTDIIFGVFLRAMALDSFTVTVTED